MSGSIPMRLSNSRPLQRVSGLLLTVVGALMLVVAALYFGYALLSQTMLPGWAVGGAGTGVAQGAPVGTLPPAERIVVPSIEVDSGVVEIASGYEDGELVWERPVNAVGHVRGTANPGEAGNVVMSGHMSSPIRGEGNVFNRLPEIALGDEVYLYSQKGRYTYRVTETYTVLPSEVEVMGPTTEPTLTLITCIPNYIYSHRFIVIAKLTGTP